MSEDNKPKNKKSFLDKLDNLGSGVLTMEGRDTQSIWENAYKKPEFTETQSNGKTTTILIEPPKIDFSTITIKQK